MTSFKWTAAAVSLAALAAHPLLADDIISFDGVTGDGFMFADPTEGVEEPGAKAVTTASGNDDFTTENGFSPQGVQNCIMANQPAGVECDAPSGSGKRWKSYMTGPLGFDMSYSTTAAAGTTEYFNYGKLTNETDARLMGYVFTLGTGTGEDFTPVAANGADGVSFDDLVTINPDSNAGAWPGLDGSGEGQNPLQRFFMPGGLFGTGGQEGSIGFYSDESAGFVVVASEDLTQLTTDGIFNDDYIAFFGDGQIARNQIPEGFFWDDDGDEATEASVVAWFHTANDQWEYGNMELDEEDLNARLAELAGSLGLEVSDLNYAPGDAVPQIVLDAMSDNALFEQDVIEDLSNMNLNYSLDVGDLAFGGFTVRVTPVFAPIVEAAGSEYQFRVAAMLDAAMIPYLGASEAYLDAIDAALAAEDPGLELERLGYSFLGAYPDLSYGLANAQIDAVFGLPGASMGEGEVMSSKSAATWSMGAGVDAFVSLGGSVSDVAATANNAGYEADSLFLTAGLRKAFANDWSAGFALGYGNSSADIDDGRGTLDADLFSVSLFGQKDLGTGTLRGVIGYQFGEVASVREIDAADVLATAIGATDMADFYAALSYEHMIRRGAFSFGPTASAELHAISVDGFTEDGADEFDMEFDDFDTTLVAGRIGMKARYDVSETTAVTGQVAYAMMSGDDLSVGSTYDGLLPGNTIADGTSRNWVDVGFGVESVIASSGKGATSLGLAYRGSFSDEITQHSARAYLQITF